MSRIVVVLAALALVATSCDSERVDPLVEFASASCAAIQTWIDAVEDEATQLSDAVTSIDRASERKPHYEVFAASVRERTDDVVRQVTRIAPTTGDGEIAATTLLAALHESERITDELVERAATFPDSDDDPEPVISRISSLLVRLEKAFSYPSHARDDLAKRYPVFDRIPACIDYDSPVS